MFRAKIGRYISGKVGNVSFNPQICLCFNKIGSKILVIAYVLHKCRQMLFTNQTYINTAAIIVKRKQYF